MDRKKLVEAALFISGKEIRREELAEMLQMDAGSVEKLIGQLAKEYEERDSCLIIRKAGAMYKMDIDQGYVEAVKKLAPEIEMSKGLLKALSFIAYKQPARQSDLVKIIGNRAYDYVHELEERGFITREQWGRTRKLETTDKFSAYFGTKDIGAEGEELEIEMGLGATEEAAAEDVEAGGPAAEEAAVEPSSEESAEEPPEPEPAPEPEPEPEPVPEPTPEPEPVAEPEPAEEADAEETGTEVNHESDIRP